MKKFIALVLAMLMVFSCACVVSAEGEGATKTLLECLGGKPGSANYNVKTSVLGKLSELKTYSGVVEVTAAEDRTFDFKAVIDMSGVKNLVALAEQKAAKKGYTGKIDELIIKGSFNVTVSCPEGVTIPDFTAEGAYSYDLPKEFVTAAPVVVDDSITFTFTVADGTTAAAFDKFADSFAICANGFKASDVGEYEFTGAMEGSTDIYEGSAKAYTINYAAVDATDEDNAPSFTLKLKKKSSSSTPNSTTPSKPSGNGSASKDDDKKDENKIETSVSGNTASVKDVTEDTIKENTKDNGLVIDAAGSKKDVDTVKLTKDTVDTIAKSDVENVEIKLGDTTVKVDDKTMAAISENAEGKDVEINVDTKAELNEKQTEAVKDLENTTSIKAGITSDGKNVEGNVTVSASYEAKENTIVLAAVVDEEGNLTDIPVTHKDGQVEFEAPSGANVTVWSVPSEKALVLTIDKTEASVFGTEEKNDVAPKIVKSRTMLPARFVAEKLGATVEWNEESQKVTIKGENINVEITIGSEKAMVNGEEVELDSPAFIENGRTYTPIRFISEALGANVNWNGATEQVVITK